MKKTDSKAVDINRAPIRPEKLAAKLAAISDYEYPALQEQINKRPRLVEMLWFIQAMSQLPGGLLKFCEELLIEFPERVGTATMRAAKSRSYTLKEKAAIWQEMPPDVQPYIEQEMPTSIFRREEFSSTQLEEMEVRDRIALTEALKKMEAGTFTERCRKAALRTLPKYLWDLCVDDGRNFEAGGVQAEDRAMAALPELWFFQDVIGAIFEFMDRHAARVQERLAMTEVAKRVFDTLEFALAEKVMVRIEGESRFGKTEAMETWCKMRPGLARLVRVPSDNSMRSLLVRVGEALGVDCSYGGSASLLRYKIEYIIQHSGLFLCLDESHFLVPQNYSTGSAPARLNWVRTEIVDRDLPVALVVTPQSFQPALSRFSKKTGYTMEQFFGRNFLTCILPTSLSEADMVAVARIHFPELDDDALGYIACEAKLSQNYLQALEAIAKFARFLAARNKRKIGLKEIEAAVSGVLGRAQTSASDAPQVNEPAELKSPRRGNLRRVNGPLTSLTREVEPARGAGAPDPILSVRSLRGVVPVKREAELVPADS